MLWNIGSGVGRLASPPAILLLLIAAGLWHSRKNWGLKLAWSALVVLWALSTPIVAYALWDALTRGAVPVQPDELPKTRAMIVVLPAGKVSAGEYPDGETASPLTVQRARYAVVLAKSSGLPLAVPGGKHRGVLSEAEATRRFVENELKHPVAVTEHASLDTRQNALNLMQPLRAKNVDTVVLVTDARHMPRASQAFAAAGFKVVRAPMAITAGESELSPLAFIPSAPALVVSFDVSHEVIGRLWYALRAFLSRIVNR
jgi:uncharacterized SAM-binding protein YcdF (DUF218 family)